MGPSALSQSDTVIRSKGLRNASRPTGDGGALRTGRHEKPQWPLWPRHHRAAEASGFCSHSCRGIHNGLARTNRDHSRPAGRAGLFQARRRGRQRRGRSASWRHPLAAKTTGCRWLTLLHPKQAGSVRVLLSRRSLPRSSRSRDPDWWRFALAAFSEGGQARVESRGGLG